MSQLSGCFRPVNLMQGGRQCSSYGADRADDLCIAEGGNDMSQTPGSECSYLRRRSLLKPNIVRTLNG